MKKLLFTSIALLASACLYAQTIQISSKNVALVYKVGGNKRLQQTYFGTKLAVDQYAEKFFEAYPPGGLDFEFEPALRVVHSDGNPSLALTYVSHQVSTDADGALRTTISLIDEVYRTKVNLHYLSYPDQDVFKAWSEITNGEKKDITLTHYASAMLHFTDSKYWLTQFHGDWAKEMRYQEQALTSGRKVIESKLGVRANKYQSQNFFLSFGEQPATETSGRTLLGSLAYTGSFKLNFELDNEDNLHASAGINNYASEYYLKPSETFETPAFIFTYSDKGKGLASRNIHSWARKFSVMNGEKPRLTLLNNWEATFFNFNQQKLTDLIGHTKTLGVDLFLLDDGWFGEKYPRDNDHTSLGDWSVDRKKLPDGIPYLVKTAEKTGVKFGIWIEPEMVSPKSELYEKHPDWILKLPNREENLHRQQLVLDLANPKVQDYVFSIVDDLFKENPNIAYIKWDCNRHFTNVYSTYLKNRQSHLSIKYVEGLYKVLKRMRAKYPDVPMMLCSGGGGRADYEALKYFTEFWPSDNTDGLERVYIQWAYSYFFPANTISAHVTSWGKQSLKFRTDVAMSGRLGYDIDLSHFSAEELAFSQQAVQNYKRLSTVIEQGDLYRLVSPYENNRSVLMYASKNKGSAVLFAYNTYLRHLETVEPVKLEGLDAQKRYKIKEINLLPNAKSALVANDQVYSGEYLMKVGIEVSSRMPESLTSTVLEIVEN